MIATLQPNRLDYVRLLTFPNIIYYTTLVRIILLNCSLNETLHIFVFWFSISISSELLSRMETFPYFLSERLTNGV